MIFDYLSVPETTSLPPFRFTDATVLPLWRGAYDVNDQLGPTPASISKPFFCSHSIRFSIRGAGTIYGVIIDYPYNEGPAEPLGQIMKLMENLVAANPVYEYYAFNKGTILNGLTGTYLLSYPWPDAQGYLPSTLHTEGTFRGREFGPSLDEQVGRVAVPADRPFGSKDNRDRIDIWDFALIYQ
ncbi:hypothetical protein M413DRAFT_448970 [Hebeloma cylindrosporum]|uniref:Uncharacterized protein n=1 Tax=Hebeloma cylindrosporum TaxID=76867 RepID=A0A0C3BYW2_HEBCY|nr:hypothetical protein M413DRAFT_448970 [Hebeloma cylindrosporum h7]